jgi:acylphosphatase
MQTKGSEKFRIKVRVEGVVQGVYFRATTCQQARRLKLFGWVRNCPDSSVEIVAEGEKKVLEQLIAWCHHGPEGAVVTQVEVSWESYRREFQGFLIA